MKLKILCCCGAGMGTCMLLKNKVDEALNELDWRAKIDCENISIAKTIYHGYDIVFTNHNLASSFDDTNSDVVIIGLENVLSVEEIKENLLNNTTIVEKVES